MSLPPFTLQAFICSGVTDMPLYVYAIAGVIGFVAGPALGYYFFRRARQKRKERLRDHADEMNSVSTD